MSSIRSALRFVPVTVVALVGALVVAVAGPQGAPASRATTLAQLRLAAANPSAIYLKAAGFTGGESTAAIHPKLGQVLSVDSSLSLAGSKAVPGTITLNRYVDSYTTQFARKLAAGTNIKTATLYLVQNAELPYDVATYELTNVHVRSDRLSFNGETGEERVVLDYQVIKLTYNPQNPDGSLGTPYTFCWNFATNATCPA